MDKKQVFNKPTKLAPSQPVTPSLTQLPTSDTPEQSLTPEQLAQRRKETDLKMAEAFGFA